jgi:hypothetical protein
VIKCLLVEYPVFPEWKNPVLLPLQLDCEPFIFNGKGYKNDGELEMMMITLR